MGTLTDIYTLSLHDALPIYTQAQTQALVQDRFEAAAQVLRQCPRWHHIQDRRRRTADQGPFQAGGQHCRDRKSTRLNSSHVAISYADFCLKKKKEETYEGA